MADRVRHHLCAILDVQFVKDVSQVVFDGVLTHDQAFGELAVAGYALHEQIQHFPFALGERRRVSARSSRSLSCC